MKVDHMKTDQAKDEQTARLKRDVKDEKEIRVLDESGEESVSGSRPNSEEIAKLAYALWEERGCPEGSADDDWFRAEATLRSRSE
jgi:hypothetical protein